MGDPLGSAASLVEELAINDGLRMTCLKHNAVLDEQEKSRIVGLCKQYTSLFADANERLQEMMAQLSNSEGVKNR